jgi:hypothetical protein
MAFGDSEYRVSRLKNSGRFEADSLMKKNTTQDLYWGME